MDGDKGVTKRSRGFSDRNEEPSAKGKKSRNHSTRSSVDSGIEVSFDRSLSYPSGAGSSFNTPSSMEYEEVAMDAISSTKHMEMEQEDLCYRPPKTRMRSMKKDTNGDNTNRMDFVRSTLTEDRVFSRPKEQEKHPQSTTKQKVKTDYRHNISIDRGQKTAQYNINIKLCEGPWSDKSYRESAKDQLLMCINAAGNSYGNNVVMDCSETNFGRKGELNNFYSDIEGNELRSLIGDELIQKKATLSRELYLHVPMFKQFRSLKTNLFDPKFESVNMKNDDLCREFLCNVKEGKRDESKRLTNFDVLEHEISTELENLKYDDIINFGKESPSIQFKNLAPRRNQDLNKEFLQDRNKLQRYVSAFASYDGGVILYGIEDKTGKVKGQILSTDKTEEHSYDKIYESLMREISNKTLWWSRDEGIISSSETQKFFSVSQYPISTRSIPKNVNLSTNEYLAVICIKIKPFVQSEGHHDGIVFGSGSGPEAYKIDDGSMTVHRLTYEEWLKEIMVKSEIDHATDQLQRMQLSFDSVSEKLPVFQLHDNARRIRERLFKVNEDYAVYPKGVVSDELYRTLKAKFHGDGSKGIILADKDSQSDVCLFVISNKHGLHFYLNADNDETTEERKELLQRKAIALKSSLCSKGGCTKDLEIHTEMVEDNGQISVPGVNVLSNTEVNEILESYIKVVGCFENQILSKQVGVEIFNVLTESQFQILTQNIHCRELWIHGLAGSGKTVLAQLFIQRLVESGEGSVLYVAENQGLVSLMGKLLHNLEGVHFVTRKMFMQMHRWLHVRNIVMDEIHHYRNEDGDWLGFAKELIAENTPKDAENEGYLWFFVDMYQKENNFPSGIPTISKQKPRVKLEQIVRCTPTIWEKVKEKLKTVKLYPEHGDGTERFYTDLLEKSTSPHNIVVEENITVKASARSPRDEFALFFQVAGIISELKSLHWRAEDIAVLFSTEKDARFFKDQYNMKSKREKMLYCTDWSVPDHCVCDSVRRFSGLDKPCVILVEPTLTNFWTHDINAFLALGMSRAMVKLVIIEK